MTRVLFVIPGAAQGSSMIFARRQAQSLREENTDIAIFDLRSRTSPLQLAREYRRFRRDLSLFRPHVVHAHFGTMTGLFGALAAWDIPLVITYRGSDLNPAPSSNRLRSALGRLLSQLAALRAARIVCVSRQLKHRLWWRRSRVTVLPSGVNPEVFRPEPRQVARARLGWPETERVVLFNAGHDPRAKRGDLARAAVAAACETLPGLRLETLDGQVDPGLIPTLMNGADCLLLTSDFEGSPTVVQEALACDLPVVSVDAGDTAERLAGVENARVVERDPASIGRALAELAATPVRSSGRTKIGEFSSRRIAQELNWLYREVRTASS